MYFSLLTRGTFIKIWLLFHKGLPLVELGVTNLDFLLFHPESEVSAIFGEAKGQVNDPKKVVDQTKTRISAVYENKSYINQNYFKNLNSQLEFVIGGWTSDTMELAKAVQRKGGGIKIWGTSPEKGTMKPELSLVRPWVAGGDAGEVGEVGKTMFHNDKALNEKLSHIETSWDYKSIFLDSHPVAKLSLLALVGEKDDGSFMYHDLFSIVKEELVYLEDEKIRKETENILSLGEQIGFIERITDKSQSYKITSRAKKADSKEEEIKKKWINASIKNEKETEKEDELKNTG